MFALAPAIGLFVVYNWADGAVDENEPAPPPPSTVVAPPPFADPLATQMLSLRRFPAVLSREVNIAGFQESLVPFLGSINDRSCVAVSVDGVAVGVQNPDLAVIPASNEKLIVAAVALEVLGADTRLTTTVSAAAAPVDGLIAGDLYLVGGGDPLLSSDWYPTSNLERYPVTTPTSLDALANGVVAAGVTRVAGAVVGDGGRYDDEFFAPGWGIGVAGLEAGPYDALIANDSRVLGDDLRAADPNEGAAREFLRLLAERGITVEGGAAAGEAPPGAVALTSIDSAPVTSIVAEMLANSDNNTAELLVKEIGVQGEGVGSREAGLRVMAATLAGWGIDTTGVVLSDGSGLSLDNRLTCAVLLSVLQRFTPDSSFGRGLPVAGESGTLANIFNDHPIAGRLSGKTGTLTNPPFNADPPGVKALAGYVTVDGGSAIEYVLVLNGPTIADQSEYRPVWNALVDVLAGYPAGATPAELGPR
ncbi:MAG: D-alanyl-D-alanine carboxypeptidase/D-alanyl-D-alanine-endopeptidase [Ilumatobacter sp.]|nr:D-alanyl-D-alanine carboxypeptidase/D-alanyl-D-alanine-endopeptidase [Ilumatobacter sp.]